MANLTLQIVLQSYANGFPEGGTQQSSITQTSKLNSNIVQSVSNSAAALDLGSVTAPCRVCVVNLDTTNTITLGTNATPATNSAGTLLPAASDGNGDFFFTHLTTGQSLYAVANAGTPLARVIAFKD